jgi:hypothetical protein
MLGVMLFFDRALLALGNVCIPTLWPHVARRTCANIIPRLATLPLWYYPHYRPAEDVLLLRAQAEATRDGLLHRRHHHRDLLEVAIRRHCARGFRVHESVWVRILSFPLVFLSWSTKLPV